MGTAAPSWEQLQQSFGPVEDESEDDDFEEELPPKRLAYSLLQLVVLSLVAIVLGFVVGLLLISGRGSSGASAAPAPSPAPAHSQVATSPTDYGAL